jgi:hypothetical protein
MPDLAAGAIGKVAEYLAEQLAELIAPTPPAEREARNREEARRAAERQTDDDLSPHQRHIEAVIRNAERAREEKRSQDYWQDREKRDRDWERDR